MSLLSVTKSCLTPCHPMDYSPPGSSVHGISQARMLEWVAISSSQGSSWPREQTLVSGIGRLVLSLSHQRNPWWFIGLVFLITVFHSMKVWSSMLVFSLGRKLAFCVVLRALSDLDWDNGLWNGYLICTQASCYNSLFPSDLFVWVPFVLRFSKLLRTTTMFPGYWAAEVA